MAPRRHLGMLWLVLLGACSPGACTQQTCRPEEAQVDGACVKRCNVQQDCLGVETCEDGLCRLAMGSSSGGVGGSSSGTTASSQPASGTRSSSGPESGATSSGAASLASSSSQAGSGTSVGASSAGGSSSSLGTDPSSAGTSSSGMGVSSSLAGGPSSSSSGLVLDVVLHGSIQLATQSVTVDLPNVDAARALLFFGVSTQDSSPPCVMVTGTVQPGPVASQLVFQRNYIPGCHSARVAWHVAVFSSGVQVQRGELTMSTTTASVPLATNVDPNASIAMAWMRADTSKLGEKEALDATLTAASLDLETTLPPSNGVVVWQVAQVEGLMAVQLPFSLGPGADHVDLTNPSLLPATHVVHFRMIHPDQDTDDTFLNVRQLAGRVVTRVERVGVGGTMLGHVQWVAWPGATITQVEDTIGANFNSRSMPAVLDPPRAFPMVPGWAHAASRSAGGGNAVLTGLALHSTTLEPTQVVAERGDTGEPTNVVVQLVQF